MADLWSAHEPDLTELGTRAERAGRFAFLSDPWVEAERHNPDDCICYLLPIWMNHALADAHDGKPPCQCAGCRKVRRCWRKDRPLHGTTRPVIPLDTA